jgi:hypothetical protein
MVRSFESYHMDQILYLRDHPYAPRQLGELIWALSHQNVLQFFEGIPKERRVRIAFEDLVTDPVKTMQEVCQHLSIEYHEGLTQPYEDADRKMTDGIYSESTPMGDTRFLEHQRIRPEMADTWREVTENDFLGDVTWRLAERLGYERPGNQRRARRGRASARSRRSSGRGRS